MRKRDDFMMNALVAVHIHETDKSVHTSKAQLFVLVHLNAHTALARFTDNIAA